MKTKPKSFLTQAVCLGALLATVHWSAGAATLTNRYTFATDASDSVGGANGALVNATVVAGEAVLANPPPIASSDVTGQYVALPPNLITAYTAVTFETWLTPVHDDVTGGAFWNRIWDFGNSDGNGVLPFFWFRSGNNAQGVRGDIVSTVEGDVINGPPLADGQRSHVVWTSDGVSKRGRIYVNGVLVGANDNVNVTPAIMGSTTNNWLGRSQFGADRYYNGTIAEFRIYNGELSPLEIAADYAAGPDTLGGGGGTVTNLQLQITSPIAINASVNSTLLAQASGLTNTINIANSTVPVTYLSGNTNILRVNSAGLVTGVGVGTTTVGATVGSVSATQSVTVIAVPTKLTHRYSFTADANDSIGIAHGTLQGGATISGGQVVLDGVAGTWVDLPPYIIHPTNFVNGAVSFEGWATCNPINGAWTRLFDFGNISGTFGANYIFFAPNNAVNGGSARTAVSDANPGFNGENGFNSPNVLGRTNIQIVVTYNPNPGQSSLSLFINGGIVNRITTTKPLSSINDAYSFLGRSLYAAAGDAWLAGSINEFRIYDGELDRFQIAASSQSGPDVTNLNVGTFTGFVVSIPGPVPMSGFGTANAIMSFTLATNVSVLGDPNLTLSSDNPSIATVANNGVITGQSVGSANLTAIYAYVSGGTTNRYTNSAVVTVYRDLPPTLTHRYSFTSDANDSVGTAHGTLTGSASVSGGALVLPDGLGSTYCQLPPGVVTNNPACTIEAWATVYPGQGTWANLFDFGVQNGNGFAAYDMHVCIHGGGQDTITGISDSDDANVHSEFVATPGVQDGRTNLHMVAVFNPPARYLSFYTNGVLMGFNNAITIQMSGVQDVRNLIGMDNWPDPGMRGTIDEFRIYNGVLHTDEIAATQLLGPNQTLSTASPTLTVARSGGNLTLSWPVASAGFTLLSRTSLTSGSWATVNTPPQILGNQWQVTLPASGSSQFFKLQR